MAIAASEVVEVGVLDDLFEDVGRTGEHDGRQNDSADAVDALFRVSVFAEERFGEIGAYDFILGIFSGESGVVEGGGDEEVGFFFFGDAFDVGQIRSARVHFDSVADVVVGIMVDFFNDSERVRPGFRENFSFRHLERFRAGKIGYVIRHSTARGCLRNLFLTRGVFLLPLSRFVPSLSQKMTIPNVNDEFSVRLARLEKIRSLGISAYPEKFEKTHSA